MAISDLPILSMLSKSMRWHQERQRLLAENVANSDTPNFKPRDLAPLTFDKAMTSAATGLVLARTDPRHLGADLPDGAADGFEVNRSGGFEVRPAGNAVSLEGQMMQVAANQMDYQTATTVYQHSLGLLKMAIGKS
jgi:flagellar basal-body rod protein FlgB